MKQHCTAVLLIALLALASAAAQDNAKTESVLKAGGSTYFTAKMDNLTEKLQLSPDQVTKIRPIAEQEIGYLEQVRANPVVSRKDKLKRLKEVVAKSDTEMKPILSADQWQKLQTMRKEQKQQLKEMAETAKAQNN